MTIKEANEKIKSLEAENKFLKLTEQDYHMVLKGDYNIKEIDQYLNILGLAQDAMPFLMEVERLEAMLFVFVQHLQYPKGRNLDVKETTKKFLQLVDGMNHTQRFKYYIEVLRAKADKTKPSILERFSKEHAQAKPQKESADKIYFLEWCENKRIDLHDKKNTATKIDNRITESVDYKFREKREKPSKMGIIRWLKAIRSK